MNTSGKDPSRSKPINTVAGFRTPARPLHPLSIPGRRPLLSGKIKFTITSTVPSRFEKKEKD